MRDPVKLIGAALLVIGLGAVAGRVAVADHDAGSTFRVGGADVTVASGWQRVGPDKLAKGHERLLVTLIPAMELPALGTTATGTAAASPVPRVPGTGAPGRARLGGYDAWRYGAARVLPTTSGALVVECRCADAVRAVSVPGASVLEPAPDLALRLRAPSALARLDAIRTKERAAWTPASAARLAAAHRAALDDLGTLAPPALSRALKDSATAYRELARTPSTSPTALTAADHELETAVAGLARTGAPRAQTPTAVDGGGVPWLVLMALVAVLAGALAPMAVRRLNARRRLAPPAPVVDAPPAKACVLKRRTPISPPPTYGRWNEAPRGPGAVPQQDGAPPVTASSSTA